jgi:hypothetical protein
MGPSILPSLGPVILRSFDPSILQSHPAELGPHTARRSSGPELGPQVPIANPWWFSTLYLFTLLHRRLLATFCILFKEHTVLSSTTASS